MFNHTTTGFGLNQLLGAHNTKAVQHSSVVYGGGERFLHKIFSVCDVSLAQRKNRCPQSVFVVLFYEIYNQARIKSDVQRSFALKL